MSITIVLNGASSSGKTTIANAIRDSWDGPLQISGIDSFLAMQASTFFAMPPNHAEGFVWQPTIVDGVDAFDIVPGPRGLALMRAAHRFWRACADEGLDQVCDDVWLHADQVEHLEKTLEGASVLWVGVRCPMDVIEQRERARGDRLVGQGRGQADLVHSWRPYDVEVETSQMSPHECAAKIMEHVR